MNDVISFDVTRTRTVPCGLHPFETRAVAWPKKVVEFERDGVALRFRPIDTDDIPMVLDFYRRLCPYFHGSARQNLLEEHFYFDDVALLSRWAEDSTQKLFFAGVCEVIPSGELIMAFFCRRDPYDRIIQNLPVVISPSYRGKALAKDYMTYLDGLWRESGADYVYGFVSAQHILSQRMVFGLGGCAGGLLPGITRRSSGGHYFRDAQVYVYKFYGEAQTYSTGAQDWHVDEAALAQLQDLARSVSTTPQTLNPPLRPLEMKPFAWAKPIVEFERQGKRFRIRPMDYADIPVVAKLYREHCPYFFRSASHYYFEESFYQEKACLLSEWESHASERLYFFAVFEDLDTQEIIMPFGTVRDPYDLMTKHLATVLKPDYRGYSLASEWMAYIDALCKESGLDYAYGLVSLQHPISQRICLKPEIGYRAGAIFPGFIRRTYDGKHYFRDAQIYMYKFYNNAETFSTPPSAWHLAPKVVEDMRVLFQK